MCGIAGLIAPAGASGEPVAAMAARIAHRGPDGEGFLSWSPGTPLGGEPVALDRRAQVWLAHKRLSIIDLTEENAQPFVDPASGVALIHNGEIYNYLELRAELDGRGHRFRTSGDTEVLLRAYLEWGSRCVERFIGMWAFAVLDTREQRLLLSRDRLGIKPLYLARIGRQLAFASEIKALLALPGVGAEPDAGVAGRYLASGVVDVGTRTFFAGIEALPAAHNVIVDLARGSAAAPERYWSLPPEDERPADADAIRQFRMSFEDALVLHSRSDVSVGTCLSGGLDSSTIVCLADRLRAAGRIPAYTHHAFGYVPGDEALSEQQYMAQVVARTGAEMTYVQPGAGEFETSLPAVIAAQDEPFGSASIAAQWFVFRAAREQGMTVMLDGQGADEVLGGYHHFLMAIAALLLRQGRPRAYVQFARDHARRLGSPPLPWGYALGALAPSPMRALATAVVARRRRAAPDSLATAADAVASQILKDAAEPLPASASLPGSLREALISQTTEVSLPSLLRYEDRNSMAHSIEARVPFLDHRLVELCFRLPDDLKIRGAETKFLLRHAMSDALPAGVLARRDKVGFRADRAVTTKLLERHRAALCESRSAPEREWLDQQGVADLLGRDLSDQGLEFLAWRVINLKLWLRSHWGDGAQLA
jgi:asparagine synthase (glutamine-hydrolysing)